jgi:hypothetical protein
MIRRSQIPSDAEFIASAIDRLTDAIRDQNAAGAKILAMMERQFEPRLCPRCAGSMANGFPVEMRCVKRGRAAKVK